MEKLIKNITRLIACHNCVIVPGMGAFLANEVPAAYNPEEQIFMPPHRTLGFNPQVTVDDALLLSEYLCDGTLSYEEAGTALKKDIEKLRNRLSRKGTYRFGELGTFSMNINSEISFVPNVNGIDDPFHFGLEPIAIPLLSECNKKDIVIKRRDFSRYIAIAAAIILAFFFVTPVSDSAYEPGMQASVTGILSNSTAPNMVPNEPTCEIAPVADTATEKIVTMEAVEEKEVSAIDITTSIPRTNLDTDSPAMVEPVSSTIYHIIVASSPNAKNAQLAIKELSRKIDTEYSVVEADRRFRVSIGSYNSSSEAETVLSEIKKTFPDAWIFTR